MAGSRTGEMRRNQKWFGEEWILQQHLATRLDPSLTGDMYDTSTGCAVTSSCAENSRHQIVSEIWRAASVLEARPGTIP